MQVSAVLLPYIAVAIVLLALATLRSWRVFDARTDLLLAALLSVLAAVVTGAVDLGTDAPAYHEFYLELLEARTIFSWWEPGFAALAWAYAWAGAPFGLFVFVCVLASHLVKLHVFNDVVSNRLLAFFVLFCLGVGELAFVRQHFAASLVLLSYLLASKNRPASALAVIFVATLFHKTALIPGGIVLAVCYGIRSVKPMLLLGLAILVVMLVLPAVRTELIGRIEGQFASYAVEEFVQGVDSSGASLFRNVVKFFAYAALAGWMLLLPARTATEQIQARAAKIVLCMSLLSALLIIIISPVFARIGNYVFPFIALSVRAERFAPYRTQFAGQYAAVLLFVLYLVAAMYPVAEYF